MSASMEETLRRFGEQFSWHPIVENSKNLAPHHTFYVAGMGGSHLGAWLIQRFDPGLDLTIHRDYGLPGIPENKIRNSLYIGSSYSGTTEETLDSVDAAFKKGMHVCAVSMGGKLLDFAREHSLPYITIPDTGLEARMAIGFAMIGIARLMGNTTLETAIREGGARVNPIEDLSRGAQLAEKLAGRIPLIWASNKNLPLAFTWKVKFNETVKIPAFCNAFPEFCHNELTGFDVADVTRDLSSRFFAIMLEDPKDHPRVQKRMHIAAQMLVERGIPSEFVQMRGEHFGKIFSTAIMGDWVTLALAKQYFGEANPQTPMVTEFKKRIAQT